MTVSNQGYKFGVYNEATTFGTADNDTYYSLRLDGDPTVPLSVSQEMEIGNKGFGHFADRDKPILYEAGREGALTTPLVLRRAESSSNAPMIFKAMEAIGCEVIKLSDDTVAASTDANTFELTTGGGGHTAGYGYLTKNAQSTPEYWHTLAAVYSSKVVTAFWDLPYAPGTGAGTAPYTRTATPRSQNVPVGSSGKTLSFKLWTRETHTSGEDLQWTFNGCGCSSLGQLVLEPSKKIAFSPTWHVANVDKASVSISAATESWVDNEYVRPWGPYSYVGIANAPSPITTGEIGRTANEVRCLKATIDFGMKSSPIPGTGSSTVNGWQGYMGTFDPAAAGVTFELLMDYTKISDWEGSNATKSIWIEQGGTSLSYLNWAFCIPQAFLAAPPTVDHFSGPYHKVTVRYACLPSEFSATGGNDSQTNSPWYFMGH